MALQGSTAVRNAILSAISTAVGAGGTMTIRTGAAPGVGGADSGTLLSTLTALVFGSPSAGVMGLTATADSSAAASGTPGHARINTSGATAVLEFDAAVGSGTLNFSGAVSLGGSVTLGTSNFTAGNA